MHYVVGRRPIAYVLASRKLVSSRVDEMRLFILVLFVVSAAALVRFGGHAAAGETTVIAEGVGLATSGAYPATCSRASMDVTFTSVDATHEGGMSSLQDGTIPTSFVLESNLLSNYSGTFSNFVVPITAQPDGTVIGAYGWVGTDPPAEETTGEFFVLYRCHEEGPQELLYSCFGPYGTCPQLAAQVVPLYEGWNETGPWAGDQVDGVEAIIDALTAGMDPSVWESIARYDGEQSAWLQTFRAAPLPSFNTLQSLTPGEAYWLFVSEQAVFVYAP